MTGIQVAAALGTDPKNISLWERGLANMPDHRKLQLAELFGCSVAWLMRWEDR